MDQLPPPPPSQQPPPPPPEGPSSDDKNYAVLIHLSTILASFITLAFVGPALVWLLKKDQSAFIDRHGKEALNFSISWTLWLWLSFLFACLTYCITFGLGFIFTGIISVVIIVFAILGAIAANEGRDYRYPLTIRFIK